MSAARRERDCFWRMSSCVPAAMACRDCLSARAIETIEGENRGFRNECYEGKLETLIKELPDTVNIEEVLHRLYLLQKIESGEAAIKEGKTLSHDEAMKKTVQNMAKLIWGDVALTDLESIYEYIARDAALCQQLPFLSGAKSLPARPLYVDKAAHFVAL